MEDIYIGTPNAKQDEFLRCKKKYVAFGGARGGGKSWAVRCKAKLLAQRYPGIRMLLVRRTMPEIEANHLETLRLELAGTAVYRAEERRFVFGNGTRAGMNAYSPPFSPGSYRRSINSRLIYPCPGPPGLHV